MTIEQFNSLDDREKQNIAEDCLAIAYEENDGKESDVLKWMDNNMSYLLEEYFDIEELV